MEFAKEYGLKWGEVWSDSSKLAPLNMNNSVEILLER